MDIAEVARLVQAVGGADMDLVVETRGRPLVELVEEMAAAIGPAGTQDLRENTLEQYTISLRLMAREGIRTVADATPLAVRRFMKLRLSRGRKTETANRNLAALCRLMTWLHAEQRVPLAHVLELRELFYDRPFTPPIPFLESGEVYRQIRERARWTEPTRRLERLIAFGVEAGLRWHEARQLHGEDLELAVAEPFLRVAHTHGRRNKTDRERTVPIRLAFAKELLAQNLGPGPLFPARAREGEALLSPYLHRGTFRTWREEAIKAGPWWNWNLLRHSFASWNVQKGRTINEVAAWLGCSVAVAHRHYARLAPGGNKLVEAAFAGVPTFTEEAA